ncbi:hypothetical protein PMAYCL1PPCAC_10449, partial [Pristionchus mayeri]
KIPEELLTGFKHINPVAFIEKFGETNKDQAARLVFVCQFTYCHAESVGNCYETCDSIGPKVDAKVIKERQNELDSNKKPDADEATCNKECAVECESGKDCSAECTTLCKHHFSFFNRAE